MSGYLTAQHAAEYLDMTVRAFDQFARRNGIPCARRGRIRLYRQATLDRVVTMMAERPVVRRSA